MLKSINDAPPELQESVKEFWPEVEWDNAVSISWLESGWNAFAVADTRTPTAPCGAVLRTQNGVTVTAEWSIGWFQINACNIPWNWDACNLYNTRHNCGTAHSMWGERGWEPWLFSAQALGLLP